MRGDPVLHIKLRTWADLSSSRRYQRLAGGLCGGLGLSVEYYSYSGSGGGCGAAEEILVALAMNTQCTLTKLRSWVGSGCSRPSRSFLPVEIWAWAG